MYVLPFFINMPFLTPNRMPDILTRPLSPMRYTMMPGNEAGNKNEFEYVNAIEVTIFAVRKKTTP